MEITYRAPQDISTHYPEGVGSLAVVPTNNVAEPGTETSPGRPLGWKGRVALGLLVVQPLAGIGIGVYQGLEEGSRMNDQNITSAARLTHCLGYVGARASETAVQEVDIILIPEDVITACGLSVQLANARVMMDAANTTNSRNPDYSGRVVIKDVKLQVALPSKEALVSEIAWQKRQSQTIEAGEPVGAGLLGLVGGFGSAIATMYAMVGAIEFTQNLKKRKAQRRLAKGGV